LNHEALTLHEFLDRIRAFLDAEPDAGPNDWLVVGAWDTGSFAADFPTKEDADGEPGPRAAAGRSGSIRSRRRTRPSPSSTPRTCAPPTPAAG
jgi:hypothetical protein